MVLLAIVIIIILLAFWTWRQENYAPCPPDECPTRMPPEGLTIINPYIWPASGTIYPDELYFLRESTGIGLSFGGPPLTHLNAPDHVVLR